MGLILVLKFGEEYSPLLEYDDWERKWKDIHTILRIYTLYLSPQENETLPSVLGRPMKPMYEKSLSELKVNISNYGCTSYIGATLWQNHNT